MIRSNQEAKEMQREVDEEKTRVKWKKSEAQGIRVPPYGNENTLTLIESIALQLQDANKPEFEPHSSHTAAQQCNSAV